MRRSFDYLRGEREAVQRFKAYVLDAFKRSGGAVGVATYLVSCLQKQGTDLIQPLFERTAQRGAITTIEGLGQPGNLHPMQEAFHQCHGLQCGFCTPGMVMSACELVARHPEPSEGEVRHWLEGNLCRCTGYHNIVQAVLGAAATMRQGGGQ